MVTTAVFSWRSTHPPKCTHPPSTFGPNFLYVIKFTQTECPPWSKLCIANVHSWNLWQPEVTLIPKPSPSFPSLAVQLGRRGPGKFSHVSEKMYFKETEGHSAMVFSCWMCCFSCTPLTSILHYSCPYPPHSRCSSSSLPPDEVNVRTHTVGVRAPASLLMRLMLAHTQ